jgi:tRNA(Ile)-lysidine synthase
MLESAAARVLTPLEISRCRVLVAVSGGVDSVVLAHCLRGLSRRFELDLCIGHVNHGLRGDESDADERIVHALGESLGVSVAVERVAPKTLRREGCSRTRPTLQEAARVLRAEALDRMRSRSGAMYIATGHNADDQAETVLMRFLRGCSPDSLGGIPRISPDGRLVRPLIQVSRASILSYAETHRLRWSEDSSNRDSRYTRNRLRHQWLPGLAEAFNPQLLRTIANLAEAHRRDSEWMESLVTAEADRRFRALDDGLCIAAEGWDAMPEALARRLVRRAILELGGGRDLSRVHLQRMLAFLRFGKPGRELELPGGLRLTRESDDYRFYSSNSELRKSEVDGAG